MVGQTLGHYRILAPIGRGAMGQVFAAEDVRLGRRVAVKLLPPEVCCDHDAVERFEREARIISSLNHPNICTLYDIGVHEGRQFMVMELLEGEPLNVRLARGPLAVADVLELGADVAGALDAAHRQNVVHRDIKPANLFVTATSGVKVLDFGVAKLSDLAGAMETTRVGSDPHTRAGGAIGTVAYMSPEQARGEAIDSRSDLFSLGVVLYEMATGHTPFPGATPAVVFEGILSKAPPVPSNRRSGLPADLDRIIARALEKLPADRYQSAADLLADLKHLQRDTDQVPVAAPHRAPLPLRAAGGRGHRIWWFGAPFATAAVVAGVVTWQNADTPALQSKDPVVLAALVNRTGDTMFDDTLSEALAVQLRQTPFLNVVPDQRIQATLRMMQRPAGTTVDAEVGREVCQRVAARALLTSAIASLGSSYVITLRALDCVTGDALAEQQTEVTRKEDVLGQLGTSARLLRERLGESLASIKRYDANIEAATTASLDALKAYSQAIRARRTQGDIAALPLFRRAVDLDPEFALAEARLGTTYANLGDHVAGGRHTERAFALRDRVSELERLYIEARYYEAVQGDAGKAIEVYRVAIATYPSDYAARVNMASLLMGRGDFEEARALLEEAIRLTPEEPVPRLNLGEVLLALRRFDDARRELEQVVALRDDHMARVALMTVAVYSGDTDLEARQLEWARAAGRHPDSATVLWQLALHRGQIREAERWLHEVERSLGAANLWAAIGSARGKTAMTLAALQLGPRARSILERMESDHPEIGSADERLTVAYLLRDAPLAKRTLPLALASVTATGHAQATPVMQAMAEAASGDSGLALATVGTVQRVPQNDEAVLVHGLMAMDGGLYDDALKDFEWIRDEGKRELSPVQGLVRFQIARALERARRTAEAHTAYAAFLDFWKSADEDLPIVVEAKRALARLAP